MNVFKSIVEWFINTKDVKVRDVNVPMMPFQVGYTLEDLKQISRDVFAEESKYSLKSPVVVERSSDVWLKPKGDDKFFPTPPITMFSETDTEEVVFEQRVPTPAPHMPYNFKGPEISR